LYIRNYNFDCELFVVEVEARLDIWDFRSASYCDKIKTQGVIKYSADMPSSSL
jgi:hypothetical protein